jgi:small GTP-binding protein
MSELHICVLGSGGVGKTSLTLMFVRGEFVEQYVPTIEDEFQKNIKIDNETIQAFIVDTAGQEEFKDLKSASIKSCEGFILVYAVDDANSVETLRENYELIKLQKKDLNNIIILGNKCDLPKSTWKKTMADVKKTIGDWGAKIPIYETSAKTGTGVNEAFEKIARIMTKKDVSQQQSTEQGCCNIQ